MLKLEDIRFPITFYSIGGGTITFNHAQAKGIRDNGKEAASSLAFYIERHNKYNPSIGDYSFEMAPAPVYPTPPTTPRACTYRLVCNGCVLAPFFDSLKAVIEAAEKYAIQHNKTVSVVMESATVTPKQITTTEVKYA